MPDETSKQCQNCEKPMADTQVRCLYCDEYVAAPLEGTPLSAEDFHNSREWVEREAQSALEHYTEDGYWLAFSKAYAAAVSKNCCGDAHMKLEAAMAMIEACGFAKQTVGNVTTWHNPRAEAAEARISELEQELALIKRVLLQHLNDEDFEYSLVGLYTKLTENDGLAEKRSKP